MSGRLALVALAVVVALAGCAGASRSLVAGGVGEKPTPTATPTPTPTPTEPEPLEESSPFAVAITGTTITPVANGVLYGVADAPPDQAAAGAAVQQATDLLGRFLDAQFVSRSTFLSDDGIGAVLDAGLLDDATRQALGVLERDDVLGTRTGPARTTAEVLLDGTVVEAVTLTYRAELELVLEDARGPVVQTGTLVLSPLQGVLAPMVWQPTTTFGGTLPEALS
jgi:hypothetical protein